MFDKWIHDHKQQIVSSAQGLLRIPSVGTESAGSKRPFGEAADQALQYMLNLGEQHGFRVRNVDGYAGHIEFGNAKDPDDYLAVLTHLDVVPAGNGWTYPPFGAEIHNDRLYARGALDDKGPAIAAYYAMLAVKESGIPLSRNVRLIMGLDEESDWRCMDFYFKHEPAPWGGFTPDADFPLIYAEKGILQMELRKSGLQGLPASVVEIKGGERPNMVPDNCRATLQIPDELRADFPDKLRKSSEQAGVSVNLEWKNSSTAILEVEGKSAHGSTPDYGVNAIQAMGSLLLDLLGPNPFLEFLAAADTRGKVIGIACQDDVTGPLTSNLGIAQIDSEGVRLVFDIRYPVDQTSEKLLQLIQSVANRLSFNIYVRADKSPLYVPKDSDLVRTLLSVYQDATGDQAEPMSIGGGTYARAIANAVAFGPLFPGAPDLAHQKDEYMEVADLLKITEIYAEAIFRLAK